MDKRKFNTTSSMNLLLLSSCKSIYSRLYVYCATETEYEEMLKMTPVTSLNFRQNQSHQIS